MRVTASRKKGASSWYSTTRDSYYWWRYIVRIYSISINETEQTIQIRWITYNYSSMAQKSLIVSQALLECRALYCVLFGVKLSHIVVRLDLFQPNQVCSVAIEGWVSVGVLHEIDDGSAKRLESPGWAPFSLDYIKAHLSSQKVNVGVEDFCLEVHFRRHYRVFWSETDFDEEDMLGVWGVGRALDEGLPAQQIVFIEHE